MSFNLVVEVATLELKESNIVTQEPVSLKTFSEVVIQTEIETIETWEVAVRIGTQEETTHVQTQVEATEFQELSTVNNDQELTEEVTGQW